MEQAGRYTPSEWAWADLTDSAKLAIVKLSGYDDTSDEQNVIDLPFWSLPTEVRQAFNKLREETR